jgi:hypothetical protein
MERGAVQVCGEKTSPIQFGATKISTAEHRLLQINAAQI